jgi:hypothetical protein
MVQPELAMKPIIKSEVQTIKCLAVDGELAAKGTFAPTRPVFLVTFRDNSELVVKGEFIGRMSSVNTAMSAKWAGKLMRQVSPDVSAKPVLPYELDHIKFLDGDQFFPPADLTRSYILGAIQDRAFTFYKMPYVAQMYGADKMDGRLLYALLRVLRAGGNEIFELGRITAVDLFNGNNDRFDFRGPTVFLNRSNLLFKVSGGTFIPVGVDFLHAESGSANLMAAPDSTWFGVRLQSKPTMRFAADQMIAVLNDFFRTEFQGISEAELISPKATDKFLEGMLAGVASLRTYLSKRMAKSKETMPVGVRKRMEALGWDQPWTGAAPAVVAAPVAAAPPPGFVRAQPRANGGAPLAMRGRPTGAPAQIN